MRRQFTDAYKASGLKFQLFLNPYNLDLLFFVGPGRKQLEIRRAIKGPFIVFKGRYRAYMVTLQAAKKPYPRTAIPINAQDLQSWAMGAETRFNVPVSRIDPRNDTVSLPEAEYVALNMSDHLRELALCENFLSNIYKFRTEHIEASLGISL